MMQIIFKKIRQKYLSDKFHCGVYFFFPYVENIVCHLVITNWSVFKMDKH